MCGFSPNVTWNVKITSNQTNHKTFKTAILHWVVKNNGGNKKCNELFWCVFGFWHVIAPKLPSHWTLRCFWTAVNVWNFKRSILFHKNYTNFSIFNEWKKKFSVPARMTSLQVLMCENKRTIAVPWLIKISCICHTCSSLSGVNCSDISLMNTLRWTDSEYLHLHAIHTQHTRIAWRFCLSHQTMKIERVDT